MLKKKRFPFLKFLGWIGLSPSQNLKLLTDGFINIYLDIMLPEILKSSKEFPKGCRINGYLSGFKIARQFFFLTL
jgi:hypothetical protein